MLKLAPAPGYTGGNLIGSTATGVCSGRFMATVLSWCSRHTLAHEIAKEVHG
jgi:hypothetical protein